MSLKRFRLHFIDEDEGTDDTEGWYVVDKQGGALVGPFGSKREAIEEGRAIFDANLGPTPSEIGWRQRQGGSDG